MQIIVYHSKARKTMCGMGTFCLIGMISLQLTIQNGDPLMGAYIQNNVITEWLISRHASCGFISSSNSSINFPASATHFFVAVTDFWSIGIIAFPYGKNETTIYLGQYDEGGKTWRWIAK